jgi:transcriptional regulator with XRE-family HTH domain
METSYHLSVKPSTTITGMKRGSAYRSQSPAFGQWLRAEIAAARMSQGEFADRVGVSGATVSRWVKGRVPDGVYIDPIARALSLDYDDLAERAGYRPELPRDALEDVHLLLDPHLLKVLDRPDTIAHIVGLVEVTVKHTLASQWPNEATAAPATESQDDPAVTEPPARRHAER